MKRQTVEFDGAWLRERRREAGFTLDQLAERCGLSPGFLSMVEKGKRLPAPASAEILLRELGVADPRTEEILRLMGRVPERPGDAVAAEIGAVLFSLHPHAATLGHLCEVTGASASAVRLALRELGRLLQPAGLVVIDDGTRAEVTFHPDTVAAVRRAAAVVTAAPSDAQKVVIAAVALLDSGARGVSHEEIARKLDGPDPDRWKSRYHLLNALTERGLLEVSPREDPKAWRLTPRGVAGFGFTTQEAMRAALLQVEAEAQPAPPAAELRLDAASAVRGPGANPPR